MKEIFVILLIALSCIVASGEEYSIRRGAIQYRISSEEFSKVARFLLASPDKYITYSTDECLVSVKNYNVTFNTLKIDEGEPTGVSVTIPKDDNMIAMTTFTNMVITTSLTLNSLDDPQTNQSIDSVIRLREVTMRAEGQIVSETFLQDGGRLILSVPRCNVLSLDVDTSSLEQQLSQHLSVSDLESVLSRMICDTYQLRFSLGFNEADFAFDLDLFHMYISTRAVYLEIKNSTFFVTQMLHSSADRLLSPLTYVMGDVTDVISEFPPIRENSAPFEVWLNSNIFDDMWKVYKLQSGIGTNDLLLHEILPILPYSNISTDGVPYMFQLYETFPDAVAYFVVKDGDLRVDFTKDDIHINMDLVGEVSVILNCDSNKRYTAFSFTMFVSIPTQVAYDNRFVTFRLAGFGGNTTIRQSNIGRVENRHLRTLFYALPQIFGPGVFDDINDRIRGITLEHMLPSNLFVDDVSISVVKDHLVIGGSLLSEKPKLTRLKKSSLDWVGDISMVPDLIFPMYDDNAEDLEPLPEQNCIKLMISGGESVWSRQTALVQMLTVLLTYVYCTKA